MRYEENFQKNLRVFREARNMTQTELAEKVYVSQSLIAHVERGFRMPGGDTICRIADLFECSVDELFGRTKYTSGSKEISA